MKILKLRFKLQKNHTSKTSEERKKKVELHTCALEHASVQKSTKTQKHTQNQKKNQKKYFFS